MEPTSTPVPLAGREIHGFNTLAELDTERLMKEAQSRWFRPNEVHAILSNYKHFKIQPQPVDRPKSGTVLLFDRKVLRNFRKDGYNWKKKKDGKNVQEAHEKLKIGNEERVHVYYARSDEDPNFYRRSFWLLDKNLERIVLVHYRQTSEESTYPNPSPAVEFAESIPYNITIYDSPVVMSNSTTASSHSDHSGATVLSEEINSNEQQAIYVGSGSYQVTEHTQNQNNEFDWCNFEEQCTDFLPHEEGYVPSSDQHMQYDLLKDPPNASFSTSQGISSSYPSNQGDYNNEFGSDKLVSNEDSHTVDECNTQPPLFDYFNPRSQAADVQSTLPGNMETTLPGNMETGMITSDNVLTSQASFERWNCVNDEAIQTLDSLRFDAPTSSGDKSDASGITGPFYKEVLIFNIVDISPEWAYSTVETKIVVVGAFEEPYKHLSSSNIYCVFGESSVPAKMVQDGVYRCTAPQHILGSVGFYLSFDGHTPISQVLSFEHRPLPDVQSNGGFNPAEEGNSKLKKRLNQQQLRLSHLLFTTTNTISVLSNKIQSKSVKEAKKYESLSSPLLEKEWTNLLGNSETADFGDLYEICLKNKLQEWLLNKIVEGSKQTLDSQGQGVIHLCVILDYRWAVRLFSLSGLSLDFRDGHGWTALHWAASLGRENMVAALLSAGANPSLVTDPTPQNPGGSTAADLASESGYEGLAAFLAEKGLAAHYLAMSQSGNAVAPPPQRSSNNMFSSEYSDNLTEQELCLKESLAAYRNAADAADRIQAAFRERALKQQTKAVQMANPVMEATEIVAALKIQHAFRNYNRRRVMKAAARIQSHFRTWQARRNFLNMRKQVIKIQAAFRGYMMRRQYNKIIWSVGILEKAVLRWRLKRKGLRGMQTEATQAMKVENEEDENVAEEDFFRIGREQAEERVKNSVVKVQSMFRSYRAQQEYRRIKLAHEQAKLEFSLE